MKGTTWGNQLFLSLAMVMVYGSMACAAEPSPMPSEASAMERFQPPSLKRPLPPLTHNGDREGRILIEIDVSATGEVTGTRLVTKRGFGQKYFANSVLGRLKRAQFLPATLNGVPVAVQGHVMTQPFLRFDSAPTVSWSLDRKINEAVKMLKDGDYIGAQAYVEKLQSDHVASAFEYSELHHRLALAYAEAGKTHHAIQAAREALNGPIGSILIPRHVGQTLMRLAASQGLLREALTTYTLLDGQAAASSSEMELASEWEYALKSDLPLIGKVRFTERGSWRHELSRSRFMIGNVKGAISRADIKCPYAEWRISSFSSDVQFTIQSEGPLVFCYLHLSGDPGTEFEIVEFAATSD